VIDHALAAVGAAPAAVAVATLASTGEPVDVREQHANLPVDGGVRRG
jgi:hypothetical protein